MKAKELAEILLEDPEREVVIASDSEGNWYSPLDSIHKYKYHDHDIGIEELTEEAKMLGYSEEDVLDCGVKAFVLWP